MRILRLPALAAATAALVGCGLLGTDPDTAASTQPTAAPCTTGAEPVALGSPAQVQAPAAAGFSTTGGTVYLTAHGFTPPGTVDLHLPNVTRATIGPAGTRPSYDEARNVVTPVVATVDIHEGRYARVDLAAGDYWLVISNPAQIELLSCTAGGVTARPS